MRRPCRRRSGSRGARGWRRRQGHRRGAHPCPSAPPPTRLPRRSPGGRTSWISPAVCCLSACLLSYSLRPEEEEERGRRNSFCKWAGRAQLSKPGPRDWLCSVEASTGRSRAEPRNNFERPLRLPADFFFPSQPHHHHHGGGARRRSAPEDAGPTLRHPAPDLPRPGARHRNRRSLQRRPRLGALHRQPNRLQPRHAFLLLPPDPQQSVSTTFYSSADAFRIVQHSSVTLDSSSGSWKQILRKPSPVSHQHFPRAS